MRFKIPDLIRLEIRYFLNNKKLLKARSWVNEHPLVVGYTSIISVFVLLVIIIVLLIPDGKREVVIVESEKAWFYDVNAGKLFVASNDETGPIESPYGPLADGSAAGVRAYVFSYEVEANEAERFIGFLEKPDPNAGQFEGEEAVVRGGWQKWGRDKLVRLVDDEQWYPANSPEGRTIVSWLTWADPNGRRAIYIKPD